MEVWHTNDLNLYVDLDELLRQRVDLHETWVDGAIEATELGDETNVSLADWLVWVGANDAAWDGTAATDERTEGVDYALVNKRDWGMKGGNILIDPYQPWEPASSLSPCSVWA